MTVEFMENDEANYNVLMTGVSKFDFESYGELRFDADQNVWVLWANDMDEAVSYEDNLADTKDEVTDDLMEIVKEEA